jgi:5-methyltetrahydrofolate--homocysteine methyltransferase
MSILQKIKEGKILISDGAWGTFLQAKGLKVGECPELWNIEHPEKVQEIAQSYIDAGADMILTNSFGGNSFKLAAYGLDEKAYELNKAAAEISRKAAGRDKFVLGSIGPTGKMIMMGEVTEEDLYEAFKEQSMALAKGGADAILIETMSDLQEAVAGIKAAKENTQCEIICTMTFEKTVDGAYKSMMGVSPSDVLQSLIDAGADIIGANCGNGTKGMIDITKEFRAINKDIPVLIHANAGLPIYEDSKTVFPESPEEMAALSLELVQAGANIIGGCCGTTPAHIAKIKKIVI